MPKKATYEELEQRVKVLEKKLAEQDLTQEQHLKRTSKAPFSSQEKINVSGITIKWDIEKGECTFENLPVAMMWVDTTLAGLMSGVQSMVGKERFALALQAEGRNSVEADWQVISQFSEFKEGFNAIANIAAVAGWGEWKLISLDNIKKECRFRIKGSWEGKNQKALGVCWGSGMLAGKLAGYASKLFSTNCWAEQTMFIAKGEQSDEFLVGPSERTIEKEIEDLLLRDDATRADMAVALQNLQKEITERERVEEEQKELQVQLSNAVEMAHLGSWEYDVANDLFTFNDYFYKIFRTTAEKVGGYKMTSDEYAKRFLHPDDIPVVGEETQKAIEATDPNFSTQIEHRIIYSDRSVGHMSVRFFIVKDKNGKTIKTYGVNQDITERKRAEERLRESEEKLARSKKMESLGLLAGGVAHDLNNVLAGIVSYPELLLLDLPEDSKFREPIQAIQDSGTRAVAIIQDLLTIARGVASPKEPLNLNDIIKEYEASPEFKKLMKFHPTVEIKTDLDKNLMNISASPIHIRKVIMNLVSNASEAIEGSGNVIISTMNCYVDRPIRGYEDVKKGEYVTLTISDDGSGILSDHLERIFEPFFTKKIIGKSGTGLGLAVVWNIVQDHEGYIDVSSDEKGTTFELYFPMIRDEVSVKDLPISMEDYKGSGESVLVVDDEENQREITCKMLDTLGYRAKAVSSGEEAVAYMQERGVDIILLDMIMDPGINGRETYERIVKIHPKQKAVIVSGFTETDEVKKTQRLGAGGYIKKPLTLQEIGLAIKEELKKS
jgi:two-component system cell cycle sensor histidine kinase/response regulator CckA